MDKGQSFCRGQIALRMNKPVLILAQEGALCLVVKLNPPQPARHRHDSGKCGVVDKASISHRHGVRSLA